VLTTRPLETTDLDLVCRHRHAMFAEAGRDAAALDAMAAPFRAWLAPRLADGRYFGFVAMDGTRAVAGIGLMEIDWPPHPLHPEQDRRGYVLNVYVEADWRRRGVAQRLMRDADDAFRARGLRYAILHATQAGRPLYETLGWQATTEMARAVSDAD
jgi:ribosomal protein S18 acetylase RimI-like enzyme